MFFLSFGTQTRCRTTIFGFYGAKILCLRTHITHRFMAQTEESKKLYGIALSLLRMQEKIITFPSKHILVCACVCDCARVSVIAETTLPSKAQRRARNWVSQTHPTSRWHTHHTHTDGTEIENTNKKAVRCFGVGLCFHTTSPKRLRCVLSLGVRIGY